MNTRPPDIAAEPALISFLLRQSRTEQVPFAKLLDTSQARVSRLTRGQAVLTADEWQASGRALALGFPDDADPVWVVTRFRTSGAVEPPPLDLDGELATFTAYRLARAVVDYLRDVGHIKAAFAVPVWPSFVREQLISRGQPPTAIKRFGDAPVVEVAETVTAWLPSAVRGFVSEQSRVIGPA